MILPDVNVLVYAARRDDPDAERYRAWLESALSGVEPVAICAPVVAGFLRVTTNPRIFERPSTLPDALGFVEALLASPAAVVPGVSERVLAILTRLCRTTGAKGNLVADAYLAAVAIDLDAELITADRGFARFPNLRWRHPLAAAV